MRNRRVRRSACALILICAPVVFLETGFAQVRQAGAAENKRLQDLQSIFKQAIALAGQGKYDPAIELVNLALKEFEKEVGSQSPYAYPFVSLLADFHKDKGDYSNAEPLYRRALAGMEKILGAERQDLVRPLYQLADLHQKKNEFSLAAPLYQRAISISEKNHGPDHPEVAALKNNLGDLYKEDGKYALAEPLLLDALSVIEKDRGADHNDVISIVINLADLYYKQNDDARAIPLYQRGLKSIEKTLGPRHPDAGMVLNALALIYRDQGDYRQAEQFFRRALDIREQAWGREHPIVAVTLHHLASLYMAKTDYTQAEPLYQRSLAIMEKSKGAEDADVAAILGELANLYKQKEEYSRAEPLYQRALRIEEKLHGAEYLEVARLLDGLAVTQKGQGRYAQAESLYQRSLAIKEKALGTEHPELSITLNGLGAVFSDTGDYVRAEQHIQRALQINEKALGKEHTEIGITLDNLALVYIARGDYLAAIDLQLRALAILEKNLGPDHEEVAVTLNNIAVLLQDAGDYRRAAIYYQRALAIEERIFGNSAVKMGRILRNLGFAYKSLRDYTRAEPLYQRSLELLEKELGPDHPDVGWSVNNQAMLYKAKGDYGKAELSLQRALAIVEKSLGPKHPMAAGILSNLSTTYEAKGEIIKAVQTLNRSSEIDEHNLALILASGSEEQKHLYMDKISGRTFGAVSLHARSAPGDPQALKLALTTVLRRKGRVLDVLSDSIGRLQLSLKAEDRAILEEYIANRSQLAKLVFGGLGELAPAQYQAGIAKLEEDGRRLESAISAKSPESEKGPLNVTPENLQSLIPQNAALVELMSYRQSDPKYEEAENADRYIVYVLRREGAAQWVELGEAAPIDEIALKLRAALRDPRRSDVKQVARELDERVMRPIRKLFGNADHLLVSPDGDLNLIPFGALVDEAGRYLIERYSITYLTSGRDLIRLSEKTAGGSESLIIGDPLYDRSSGSTPAAAPPVVGRRSSETAGLQFNRLPGSAKEAEFLGRLLSGAKVVTGGQATESSLKQSRAPRILHIATHGFFLSNRKRDEKHSIDGLAGPVGNSGKSSIFFREENPLLRSGLALAGANQKRGGDNEDGIATALEMSGLNLRGTKLVVLSACETGIGTIRNGDGVYGLRRALVLAGAESQVTTLWRVDDEATRDLMIDYYRKLQAGSGRTESLRKVQLEMLKNEEREHPYFWAGFIQLGDWRPLDNQ